MCPPNHGIIFRAPGPGSGPGTRWEIKEKMLVFARSLQETEYFSNIVSLNPRKRSRMVLNFHISSRGIHEAEMKFV